MQLFEKEKTLIWFLNEEEEKKTKQKKIKGRKENLKQKSD